MAIKMSETNVKVLIDHVERDRGNVDIFFLFILEFYGKRIWECSLKTDFNKYKKPKFFIGKLLSPDITGHALQAYLQNFIQSVKEIDGIQNFYLKKNMLNERGRFCQPGAYYAYEALDAPLPFEDAQPKDIIKRMPDLEIDNINLGKPVFSFYRFHCFVKVIIMKRTYLSCRELAYSIVGIEPFEHIQIQLFFNGSGQVIRMKTIVRKGFDWEIAQYARLHFTTNYLEKKFEFALKEQKA